MHHLVWLIVLVVVAQYVLRKQVGRKQNPGPGPFPPNLRQFADRLGVEETGTPQDFALEPKGIAPSRPETDTISKPIFEVSVPAAGRSTARHEDRITAFYRAALGPGLCSPRKSAPISVPSTARAAPNR